MFNIGPTEVLVILAIALLVVGPKRLPDLGKTVGKSMREFRRAQEELKSSFDLAALDEPIAKPKPAASKTPTSKSVAGEVPTEAEVPDASTVTEGTSTYTAGKGDTPPGADESPDDGKAEA